MKKNGNKLSPFIVYYYLYIIFDINFVNKSWPTMAELSITLADVSMTFGRTVMAEVSTEHGRCVIWPNRLSTVFVLDILTATSEFLSNTYYYTR